MARWRYRWRVDLLSLLSATGCFPPMNCSRRYLLASNEFGGHFLFLYGVGRKGPSLDTLCSQTWVIVSLGSGVVHRGSVMDGWSLYSLPSLLLLSVFSLSLDVNHDGSRMRRLHGSPGTRQPVFFPPLPYDAFFRRLEMDLACMEVKGLSCV